MTAPNVESLIGLYRPADDRFPHRLCLGTAATLILRHVEGREYCEVARVLGRPEGPARMDAYRPVKEGVGALRRGVGPNE
jgi:hypothetical protein